MEGLSFNRLLRDAGLPLDATRLVRHQDARGGGGRTPYELWLAQDGSLDRYQQIQSKACFKAGQWLASFVATPLGETLFAGIHRVHGVGKVPEGTLDPVGGHDVSGLFDFDIRRESALAEYAGRLVVDWGAGYRAWIQRADNRDKPIVELRRSAVDPAFPGFAAFRHPIRSLDTVAQSWRAALAAVGGVYLLVSQDTGKAYVGSAYGAGGFWARWEHYSRTGHGGNQGMRLAADQDYLVSILEVASSTASEREIIRMEALWKDKLLSRRFGLNRN